MTYTAHQECHTSDAPAFARLADRIEAGEDAYAVTDHMTVQQINHAARVCAGNRPLSPWIEERANAAALIREMIDGLR